LYLLIESFWGFCLFHHIYKIMVLFILILFIFWWVLGLVQEEGWPFGLRLLNSRVGVVRNGDFSGSGSFSTLLSSSPTPSTYSSSDLDTQVCSFLCSRNEELVCICVDWPLCLFDTILLMLMFDSFLFSCNWLIYLFSFCIFIVLMQCFKNLKESVQFNRLKG